MEKDNKSEKDFNLEIEKLRAEIETLKSNFQIERELLIYENKFLNTIFDSLDFPLFVINTDNYEVEKANKNSRLQFTEKNSKITCHEITHNSDSPCNSHEHVCPITEVKKHKTSLSVEHIHKGANGKTRFVQVNAHPIFDELGNVVKIIEYHIDITDKKENDLMLLESEAKFRLIFENVPIGICFFDSNCILKSFNEKYVNIFGTKSELLTNFDLTKLQDENIVNVIKKALLGELVDYEGLYHSITSDKSTFIRIIVSPIFNNDGSIRGGIGLVEDITESKESERLLKISEEKYRLLTEFTSDVIWVLNITTGKFTYISPSVFYLRGITSEEALAESLNDALSPESKVSISNAINSRLPHFLENPNEQAYYIYEIQQPHRDGRMIWVEVSTKYRFNENNEIEIVGVSRNIDERKKLVNALKESEAKLRAMFDSANIGISITDVKGNFIMFNKWWADFLLLDEETLYQKNNYDITHPDDIELSKDYYKKVISGEIKNYSIDKRYIRSDFNVVWGNLSVAPIFNSKGELDSLVRMVIDITDHKIAEEKLQSYAIELEITNDELRYSKAIIESNLEQKSNLIFELEKAKSNLESVIKEKDKFFSIIAHDLRSPLGTFINMTALLRDKNYTFTVEEQDEMLNLLKNSADNVYELLENLLQWSRSQRGTIQFSPTKILLSQLINQIRDLYTFNSESKQISIEINIPDSISVNVDEAMMSIVLRNLLSNSIKFTRISGKVEIGISEAHNFQKQGFVIVYIRDNGVGMNSEYIENLFKLDSCSSCEGTAGEKGTGLGLILCKEFIERHEGIIWVESEEDKGSTFFFSIPLFRGD